jgi:hypothetical protein
MPRFTVTGPDDVDYGWLVADSPIEALHRLHAEALGPGAVCLVDGEVGSADPNRSGYLRWLVAGHRMPP